MTLDEFLKLADEETKHYILVSAVALVLILCVYYAFAAQESRVFNKLTGAGKVHIG